MSADQQGLLRVENERLREQLREAEETLAAIRNGDVDAVVVSGPDNQPRIYTLETADRSYRRMVEEMQEGALTLTALGGILYCNPRMATLLDQEPTRLIGTSFRRFLDTQDWPTFLELITTAGKREFTLLVAADRVVSTHLSFSAIHGDEPEAGPAIFCCIVTDLTDQRRTGDALRSAHDALLGQMAEREKTEALLRQSQKMEAVGQLTGGVAHDFNNLLMVITGGLAMLRREPTAERRTRLMEGMRQAAERGAALTRQLLAFSRGKELHPGPIDLPTHLAGLRELLDRSLGSIITVGTDFEAGLWPVRVDAGEFEIALLNLCVNARDAMPKGGVITITGRNRSGVADADPPGDFVLLSVQDTGSGMTPETIARCLEPFFTTKEIGKGSGLGLAQVYGFAQASGGSVSIDSQVGVGTTVSLLLPRSSEAPAASVSAGAPDVTHESMRPRASGHVLLVEDDDSVAELTEVMLAELGYRVTHAPGAIGGLDILKADPSVDVVLSDVMMPGLDGVAFARAARLLRSTLPIVLASGFVDGSRQEAMTLGIPLLAKPYTLGELAGVLDGVRAARR